MAEPSQAHRPDPRQAPPHDSSREGRTPLLDGLEMGLELAVAGRVLREPLRRLPLRAGARLAGGGLRAVSRGAAAAALLEAPVALIEETLAVRRGRKTAEQAALAAGAKVGVAAVGGGLGAGLAYGLGSLGVGSVLLPVAPALLLVGGATVVVSTGLRLRAAFAAGSEPPALHPEPPQDFIEMEPGHVVAGTEIWVAPPAAIGENGHDPEVSG